MSCCIYKPVLYRVFCVDSPEFVTSSIIFGIILEVIWLTFKLMGLGCEDCCSGGRCSPE